MTFLRQTQNLDNAQKEQASTSSHQELSSSVVKTPLTLVLAFIVALVCSAFAVLAMPQTAQAAPETVTVVVNYVETNTGHAVASSYKAVLEPGEAYSVDSPTVDGYTLEDSSQATISGTADTDTTITVHYVSDQVTYTVNHYFQTVDGIYVVKETQQFTGNRNDTVQVTPLDRENYVCTTTDLSVELPSQGTVTKDLYYDMVNSRHAIYFQTDGGTYVPYIVASTGEDISASKANVLNNPPERTGYTFVQWSSEIPDVMPDHNVYLRALWAPGTASYRVVYWAQSGDEYVMVEERTLSGTVGSQATYEDLDGLNDACYELERADSVTIAGDGSTVLNVYYQHYLVTVNFYHEDPFTTGQTPASSITVRAGDQFYFPDREETLKWYDDNVIHGAWGDYHTWSLRWCFYNYNYNGYVYYSDADYGTAYARAVNKTTHVVDVYPFIRDTRDYTYYVLYYEYNPTTGNYELSVTHVLTDSRDTGHPTIPNGDSGYALKYIAYSTEAYDGTGDPVLGAMESVTTDPLGEPNTTVDADGNIPENRTYYTDAATANVLALYYYPNNYTLRYFDRGTELNNAEYPYGTLVNLNDYQPAVPSDLAALGYTFGGWYKEGDTDQTVINQTTISDEGNNYWAKWVAPVYTVTFDSDGGTEVLAQRVTRNQKATKPADPVKDEAVFVGWFNKADGVYYEFDREVTSDIDLIAYWSPPTPIVDYDVIHKMADGTIIKTEHFQNVASRHYVVAQALDVSDPDYPANSVPNYVVQSRLLSPEGENSIVFVYTPFPLTHYVVRYVDMDTGEIISRNWNITDYAQIMTVVSKEIPGYLAQAVYGRGTVDNPVITLLYKNISPEQAHADTSSVDTSKASHKMPATGDGAKLISCISFLVAIGSALVVFALRKRDSDSN